MIDKKKHSDRKRMLSNVYSKSVILASPTVKETTKSILYDRLLPIFEQAAVTNTPIDVHRLDYAYAMGKPLHHSLEVSLTGFQTRSWPTNSASP